MLIKFELAKRLQELDIVPGNIDLWAYDPNQPSTALNAIDEFYNSPDEYLDTLVPTYQQSELQTYLRNRKILVEVVPVDSWDNWTYAIYMEDCLAPFFRATSSEYFPEFPTYEDALEAGLTKAIDFL